MITLKNKAITKFIKIVEDLNWTVDTSVNDNTIYITVSQYSPAGQDFNSCFEVEVYASYDDIINAVYDMWQNFDVSQETYIWLDETGHGKNGAPYHLEDILNDMKACDAMLETLYNKL